MGVNHKCRIRSSILVEKVNAKKIDLTPIIYTEQGELGAIENALEPTSPFFTNNETREGGPITKAGGPIKRG